MTSTFFLRRSRLGRAVTCAAVALAFGDGAWQLVAAGEGMKLRIEN